jgi:hypothetical protein
MSEANKVQYQDKHAMLFYLGKNGGFTYKVMMQTMEIKDEIYNSLPQASSRENQFQTLVQCMRMVNRYLIVVSTLITHVQYL